MLGDRGGLAGHAVLVVDPPAKVDQLAVFGTERTMGIILPLDRLVAVWTLHENKLFAAAPVSVSGRSQRLRPFDQDSSPYEIDRTFAAHGIQAHSNALARRADN